MPDGKKRIPTANDGCIVTESLDLFLILFLTLRLIWSILKQIGVGMERSIQQRPVS